MQTHLRRCLQTAVRQRDAGERRLLRRSRMPCSAECGRKNNEGVTLGSAVIVHRTEPLLRDANCLLRDDEEVIHRFSKVWLARLKERFDFRFRRVHGDVMRAEDDATRLECHTCSEYFPRMLMQISGLQISSDVSTGRCPVGGFHKSPFRGSIRKGRRSRVSRVVRATGLSTCR